VNLRRTEISALDALPDRERKVIELRFGRWASSRAPEAATFGDA
jgi:hypothetical protein